MNWNQSSSGQQITALLIAADPQLSSAFQETLRDARTFQILGELTSYPSEQVLEMRLNQSRPLAVLIDVATNLDKATDLIQWIAAYGKEVYIVGLHRANDSSAILRSLRAGASEFLHAPFDPSTQREAVARLVRMRQPAEEVAPRRESAGNLVVFSSTKPGSGSSTISAQVAFALHRILGGRVLLADFDLMGGALGFYLKLDNRCSLIDAMDHADHLDAASWNSLAEPCGGIDILPAPAAPEGVAVDGNRLAVVLDSARQCYDWTIIDLPTIFQRISMMTAAMSDQAFLVTTSELPSLHLARKSVALLEQIGLPKERVQMLVNRISRWDGIGTADLEKLFNCPVYSSLPNDYFSLHRVITLGQPLGPDSDLGKAIEGLAGRLAGPSQSATKRPADGRAAMTLPN
jgi:pilus assembly protein CpaE